MSIPKSAQVALLETLGASLVQQAADKALGAGVVTVSFDSSGLAAGLKLSSGHSIALKDFTYDSGEVSGEIAVDFSGAGAGTPLSLTVIPGFDLSLEAFSLTISRNSVTQSDISGSLAFPAFWNHDPNSSGVIRAEHLTLGPGGISGTLSLKSVTAGHPSPVVDFKFGDSFSVGFTGFSITLNHGVVTDSTIEGTLVIPGFKDGSGNPAKIFIQAGIHQNGDFDITAHEDHDLQTISCAGVFDLALKSVFFGKHEDDFYLGVAGTITFTHKALSSLAPIEIEKLVIWSDGRFEIEGGTIPLPQNIRFPIGPVEISISAIHLGSHQQVKSDGSIRDFRYFGFDGGVDVNPGGVHARGKGIKFFYPADLLHVIPDSYLQIESIAIDLVIPGSASKETATALISGFLSLGGTPSDPVYEGGVSFALPKAKIAGGASIVLRPKIPAFLVDAFVELSTPLLLGSTDLGAYGFRGLFGQRYVATKAAAGLPESAMWFDYYKAPAEGVNIAKFEGPSQTKSYDGAFSIGAGVSLATVHDSGKTFSLKLFLLLSLPDLIYLEGRANILGDRVGLTGDDPPFFAMLAITSQSVETGVGVHYQLPRDGTNKGWILDLNAEMRAAFFFKNSSAWYIHIGTPEHPTTARVLSIFDATSYLMLSAAGIAAGAATSYEFDKSYAGGLVHASAGVYIKLSGFVSFERPQIGGSAMLGGHVDVSLMGFGFHIVIDTSLSVEVPKPFYVEGMVHLCVGITIGFWKFKKRIEKCFDVEFKWEKDPTLDTTPVLPLADLDHGDVRTPVGGTNMLSGESFKIAYLGSALPSSPSAQLNQTVLPLDSWVDVEFLKGLVPGPAVDARIGRLSGAAPANAVDKIPPAEVPHKVTHEYSIKAAEIKAWDSHAWVDYRPYQAMSPPAALAALNANPTSYKDGFWQNSGNGFNKLRFLSETSLSYMQQGQLGWYVPEQFGITSATLFCTTKLRRMRCLKWNKVATGTVYPKESWHQLEGMLFRITGASGAVVPWNSPFHTVRSLVFSNDGVAQVVFDVPCVQISLKLTTFSSGAVIRFYQRKTAGAGIVYKLVETRVLSQLQLLAKVEYDNVDLPVTKVEIDPLKADTTAIYQLEIEIEKLTRLLYETKLSARQKDALLKRIESLKKRVRELTGKGCAPEGFNPDALIKQIRELGKEVVKCRTELAELQAQQVKICRHARELQDVFNQVFSEAPSRLSYELIDQPGPTGRYGFLVYDDLTNAGLLKSNTQFGDAMGAETALREMLEAGRETAGYLGVAGKSGRYSFRVVDSSGNTKGESVAVFKTAKQRDLALTRTREAVNRAFETGKLIMGNRSEGSLPCEMSAVEAAWWEKLSAFTQAAAGECSNIADELRAERKTFCVRHNKLYRRLYACHKQVLDAAEERCQELTRQLQEKRKTCKTLSDQLAALLALQDAIDQKGPLAPPKGFVCVTLLHEACGLSLEDYQFNLSAPGQTAIEEDYQTAVGAIMNALTPIWRPKTQYCIRLQVTDTVHNTAKDTDFYFGFRTAGPLGYFHSDPSADYVKAGKTAEQYMLTGLKGYIDYGRSYPNADGELIRAKPLFYEDARILLFFSKPYVYHFFGDWPSYNGLPALTGSAMQIVIKDPSEDISLLNPPPPDVVTTEVPQAIVAWASDDDPRIPEDIRTLANLRNPELLNPAFEGGHCWISGGDMIKPASVHTTVTPKYLKPLKLYTAIVNNVWDGTTKEVHRYVFQTSRYPDFLAQIRSYRLDDGKGNRRDAVFAFDLSLAPADVNLVYNVVAGNMSPANEALAPTWADPFDRLISGVMKMAPLDPPVSTEFNIVRNTTSGDVIGVWIRNPESFNDPKLPPDIMQRGLQVMNGLVPDPGYKVLFAKDCSQAFVMPVSKVIAASQIVFRFAYIEWNGHAYQDREVVISDAIPTIL
jgi:hypothetical protein